jgi:Cu/Zn superoxide dismutase
MPNQFVGQDGLLRIHVLDPNVTLEIGEGTLFGADRTSIIVHAKGDDIALSRQEMLAIALPAP